MWKNNFRKIAQKTVTDKKEKTVTNIYKKPNNGVIRACQVQSY